MDMIGQGEQSPCSTTGCWLSMNSPRPLARKALQLLASSFFGIACAFGVCLLILWLFPDLVLAENPAYTRLFPNWHTHIDYRISDGNLYTALPGQVRPPENDEILASFDVAWDADGFRLPQQPAARYPIAIFGDSFAEGANAALPFPDVLASRLGVPVYNYGYHGYGPIEVSRAVTEFANREARRWVLYAFFSGNDLGDTQRIPPDRSPLALLSYLLRGGNRIPANNPIVSDHYNYPLPVIIGGNYYELAFLPYYLSWQIAPPEGFAGSHNFEVFAQTLDNISETLPVDTCLGLIFIPTKEQLYYPYVHSADRQWLRGVGGHMGLSPDNRLVLISAPISAEEEPQYIASFVQQHDAVAQAAAERPRWHFIDLLPAFEEAVAQGRLLYYPMDSHWNHEGHTFAAQVIAEYMEGIETCSLP
jgi:hypothetical protein